MVRNYLKGIAIFLFSVCLFRKSFSQCTTGAYWLNGPNSNGSLRDTAIVDYFDSVIVVTTPPTSGSFQASPARPLYLGPQTDQWGSASFEGVQVYRGGGRGAKTSFVFKIPKDSSQVHFKVLNVRGDGFLCSNCEYQKITGYRQGNQITASYKALLNGASVSGDVLQGATTTTSTTQSEARIFFNNEIDSVVVESVSLNDFIVIELHSRCYSVLPVSWQHFTGEMAGERVQLKWICATATANSVFTVEKWKNNSWLAIVSIPGNRYANSLNQYATEDPSPNEGDNVYRIRMTNTDGTLSYSEVIHVRFRSSGKITTSPNPASESVTVKSSFPIATIELVCPDGRTVLKQSGNQQLQQSLILKGIPSGLYYLTVASKEGAYKTVSVVKKPQ